MQATTTPSASTALEEQSQAPACQGGRTHGVYAPRLSEAASGAVHGSLGFNPMAAPGQKPGAAATKASRRRRWISTHADTRSRWLTARFRG